MCVSDVSVCVVLYLYNEVLVCVEYVRIVCYNVCVCFRCVCGHGRSGVRVAGPMAPQMPHASTMTTNTIGRTTRADYNKEVSTRRLLCVYVCVCVYVCTCGQ